MFILDNWLFWGKVFSYPLPKLRDFPKKRETRWGVVSGKSCWLMVDGWRGKVNSIKTLRTLRKSLRPLRLKKRRLPRSSQWRLESEINSDWQNIKMTNPVAPITSLYFYFNWSSVNFIWGGILAAKRRDKPESGNCKSK